MVIWTSQWWAFNYSTGPYGCVFNTVRKTLRIFGHRMIALVSGDFDKTSVLWGGNVDILFIETSKSPS